MPKVDRTDKRKSRPGLVDPFALYQSLRTLILYGAVYESRMYGAMRGSGKPPHTFTLLIAGRPKLNSYIISLFSDTAAANKGRHCSPYPAAL